MPNILCTKGKYIVISKCGLVLLLLYFESPPFALHPDTFINCITKRNKYDLGSLAKLTLASVIKITIIFFELQF